MSDHETLIAGTDLNIDPILNTGSLMPGAANPKLLAYVAARTLDRSGALRLELRSKNQTLPAFEAGAHIDLFLSNGMIRSYSLLNDQNETDRYVIGVGLDRNSRGGSAFVHNSLVEGYEVEIGPPKNLFRLEERAARTVLFAGGIGVTPFLAMSKRLQQLGKDWHMHVCARARTLAPFFQDLENSEKQVTAWFDDERDNCFIDFNEIIASEPAGTHFYCCGPAPMIDAFERAASTVSPEQIHTERFSSDELLATEGGFVVELARSGKTVDVTPGRTILEVLQAIDIDVPFSCLAGVCGSCRTAVVAGIPDHRDLILTNRERRLNDQMMICCSGSLSERLVLDL